MSQTIDPAKEKEFKILQLEGKQLAAEGKLEESLQKYRLAKEICPTAKVLSRIEKLKECLKVLAENSKKNCNSLSTSSVPNELYSKKDHKVSPNVNSTGQNAFVVPKVLNDIQNVQKSNAPRTISKSADLSPKSQSKFRELKKLAKETAYAGKYDDALEYFRTALTVCDCPNVRRYMEEIQLVKSSNEEIPKAEDASDKVKKQEFSSTLTRENIFLVKSSNEEIPKAEDASDNVKKQEFSSTLTRENIFSSQSESDAKDSNDPDVEKNLDRVKVLYEEARDLASDGNLEEALKRLKKAQSIHETQKVQKRITKLEGLISSNLNDSESNKMIKITEEFSVFHDIYNKLYPYQREGVAWLWKLYKMGKGGVLGDDMGLGKTFQVIAFISGMIDADLVKHVIIIMPVSLLQNWSKEFKKWCPGILVHDFHSGSKKERERNLLRVQKRGHVLLTSYGMVVNNVNTLIEMEGREFVWDYVILDEGHKIKNPTKTTKAVYEIPSRNRLVLTGTPIQNNLRELWSLYDFVHQGTLLGSARTFKMQYENSITRSREKDATAGEKRLGTEMAENLKSLIKPYFLRRTKDEIWGKKTDCDLEQLENQMEKMTISKVTAKKNDFILWTYMSESQIQIYTSFLHSSAVKSILVSKRSPLVELTTLKKICDHPRLLSQRACIQLGLNGEVPSEDLLQELDNESSMASSIDNVSDETLLYESGKLKLVLQLLEHLKETGHRTLVFSLSRKILDMIHRILVNRNWKVMRLDGTISKTEERERRIQRFQNDPSYPVFLLTTQVGGVGITLTAADRVIIYDPSWNPATDAQAVDRVYRIGQQKDVVVYRLITCGSVEEKIYRRQIFKDSITRQATGVADPYRYFSKQELRELFSLDNVHYSATQVQLSEMHSSQRHTDDQLNEHIQYLQTLNIFGISDHDLMFSKNIQDDTEDNDEAAVSDNFIKKQVSAASELIKMEASVVAEGIRMAGTYNRPYQETLPLSKKGVVKDLYKPPVLPQVIDLTESAQDNMPLPSEQKTSMEDNKSSSPDSRYQDGISFDNAHPFPSQMKIEDFFSNGKEKIHSITPKNIDDLLSLSVKMVESSDLDPMNASINIEKLRKSMHGIDPSSTFWDGKRKSDILNDKNTSVNLEENDLDKEKAEVDDLSISLKEQNASGDLELIPKFHGRYENNTTQMTYEDLKDLSFGSEVSYKYVKSPRKSCARKSALLISDSDTSSNESKLNATVNFANDSEDDTSEACDFSNSASLSFVPDSTPATPETATPKEARYVIETPPLRVFGLEPESVQENSLKSENSSLLKNLEGSVGGITPLKVDKSLTSQDSSFAHAMATSLILTPCTSPVKKVIEPKSVSSDLSLHISLSRPKVMSPEDGDSPIKYTKKKKAFTICSDSENSDNEGEDVDLFPGENVGQQSYHSNNADIEDLVDSELEHSRLADDDDSPIKSRRKLKRIQLCSDSEESYNERDNPGQVTDKNSQDEQSDECDDSENSTVSEDEDPSVVQVCSDSEGSEDEQSHLTVEYNDSKHSTLSEDEDSSSEEASVFYNSDSNSD